MRSCLENKSERRSPVAQIVRAAGTCGGDRRVGDTSDADPVVGKPRSTGRQSDARGAREPAAKDEPSENPIYARPQLSRVR
jgi:hypothetical protein